MNDFTFKYLFEISKDKAFVNSTQFRHHRANRYGINEREFGTRLYTAINNYQVKKYGRSINPQYVYYSKETEERKRKNSNARKNQMKNRKGFWLN